MATNQTPPQQAAPTGALTVQQNKGDILALIQGSKFETQLEAALMKRVPKEFFLRIATSSLNHNAKLQQCVPVTVAASLLQLAQAGLAPEEWKGHGYLIPRKNNHTNRLECTALIGYRGFIHLAYRSPMVTLVNAFPVYGGDIFDLELGSGKPPVHKPWTKPEANRAGRGEFIGAYAVVKLKTTEFLVEWMTKEDIDAVRKRSQASGSGPWVTDYVEMARKTPLRRLFKWIPDENLQRVAAMDEAAELGHAVAVVNGETGEIEYEVMEEEPGDASTKAQNGYEAKKEAIKEQLDRQKEQQTSKTDVAQPAAKAEAKPEPKAESKPEPKAEPKPAPKAEPKLDAPTQAVDDPLFHQSDRGLLCRATAVKVWDPKAVGRGVKMAVDLKDGSRLGCWDKKLHPILAGQSVAGPLKDKVCVFVVTREDKGGTTYTNIVKVEKVGSVEFMEDGTPIMSSDDAAALSQKPQGEEPPEQEQPPDESYDEQPAGRELFPPRR